MSIADGAWKRWFAPGGGNGAHDDRSAAGNASGASSGQASHRRQPGQRWQTFKNAFWNTTRYVLIAGMFALLLTMVILLNEVMTFHNGIKNQVGEAYARGVVLMLDEMNRNPEAYPEERALPVAELAVELDGVRRALRELELFGKIQPARGPAPAQAAGQAAAGSAGGSPAPSGWHPRGAGVNFPSQSPPRAPPQQENSPAKDLAISPGGDFEWRLRERRGGSCRRPAEVGGLFQHGDQAEQAAIGTSRWEGV